MIMVSCAVIIGILLGYFTKSYINFDISLLIQFGLYLLLFFIGIDIGKNDNILNDLKKLNKKVLFLPFITIHFFKFIIKCKWYDNKLRGWYNVRYFYLCLHNFIWSFFS